MSCLKNYLFGVFVSLALNKTIHVSGIEISSHCMSLFAPSLPAGSISHGLHSTQYAACPLSLHILALLPLPHMDAFVCMSL